MKIYKFGGASVGSASGVVNLSKVLRSEGHKSTFIVISAMGKMTNAFEQLVDSYLNDVSQLQQSVQHVKDFHYQILHELFEPSHSVFKAVEGLFNELEGFIQRNEQKGYNYVYDQVVPFGELLATTIVSFYLNDAGIANTWIDVRSLIKTDSTFRDAKVDWDKTKQQILKQVDVAQLNITQGFIGFDGTNTTTLGREGSDFSAAIIGYSLDAQKVVIWKDVEGVYNADPRVFEHTQLLRQISYKEAIEMSFYGASVIHPKTLKPLENKLIPLYVRSFKNLEAKGTLVTKGVDIDPKVPCFVVKKQQRLVSISAQDFSFILEQHISEIFQYLHQFKLKVNLIQNSALSFSMCIEDKYNTFFDFYEALHGKYRITYNENLTLFTIRHFNIAAVLDLEKNNTVLLKQTSRETVQMIIE